MVAKFAKMTAVHPLPKWYNRCFCRRSFGFHWMKTWFPTPLMLYIIFSMFVPGKYVWTKKIYPKSTGFSTQTWSVSKIPIKIQTWKTWGLRSVFSTCHPFLLLGYLDWKVALPLARNFDSRSESHPQMVSEENSYQHPQASLNKKQKKYSLIASNCLLIRVSCVCIVYVFIQDMLEKTKVLFGQRSAPKKRPLLEELLSWMPKKTI